MKTVIYIFLPSTTFLVVLSSLKHISDTILDVRPPQSSCSYISGVRNMFQEGINYY